MRTLLTFIGILLTTLIFSQKLDVDGKIKIGDDASLAEPGTIRWTGTDFEGWNGIIWVSLTGHSTVGSVTDIDGNTYQTIRIGNQEWMIENLRTSKYRGGTIIDQVTSDGIWMVLTSGAWCWYDNFSSNEDPYGKLYNWYAVAGDSLCPVDWHVPSDIEWTILTDYLGGETVAGGRMKETGITHWSTPNAGASNESGFTGIPGGYRNDQNSGQFLNFGNYGYWWSTTEYASNPTASAWYRFLYYDDFYAGKNVISKRHGHSVRCLKD